GVFTKLNKQMPARVLYSRYTQSKKKEKPAWKRYNYYSLGNTLPIITIARSELDGGITRLVISFTVHLAATPVEGM
ncbi:MAG TPA: hypothetical protein VFR58_11180, partial [Flavisolibacter sp.]|nr:hypothetical protein [Flavisolibacter sp.]